MRRRLTKHFASAKTPERHAYGMASSRQSSSQSKPLSTLTSGPNTPARVLSACSTLRSKSHGKSSPLNSLHFHHEGGMMRVHSIWDSSSSSGPISCSILKSTSEDKPFNSWTSLVSDGLRTLPLSASSRTITRSVIRSVAVRSPSEGLCSWIMLLRSGRAQ